MRASERDGWGAALVVGAMIFALAGAATHVSKGREARAPVAVEGALQATLATQRPSAPAKAEAQTEALTALPAQPAALPASLAGTGEDGALRVDEDGHLVIEPAVIRLFDYYLSATGEESAATIRARIVAAIHRHLGGGPAAREAIALLDSYVGTRESTRRLAADSDDLPARLDAVRSLRRRAFGGVDAEKLFGEEERATEVAIAQRRALMDPADTVARDEATAPLRRRAEEENMRAGGASEDDVRAYRVARVGEAAADRLRDLDERRAAWRARVMAFRAARAAILQAEADPAKQRAKVKELLEGGFTDLEQIRVEAADRMEAP